MFDSQLVVGVADQRILECGTDPFDVGLAATAVDAPDGLRVERDGERLVDRVEDARYLVVVANQEDPGHHRRVGPNPLGESRDFPRPPPGVGLDRVRPRTERVLRFARTGLDAQVRQCRKQVLGRLVIALVQPRAEVVHRSHAGERDGRTRVGDGAAPDFALDWREIVLGGEFASPLVSVGTRVAPPEGDLSVGSPDANRWLALFGDPVRKLFGDGAVGIDRLRPTAIDAHTSASGSTLKTAAVGDTASQSQNGRVMRVLPQSPPMAVTLSADVLSQYQRVTLYNSPFAAHDRGCAVDLYPGDSDGDTRHPNPEDGESIPAPSPVAGEVVETRTVTAPSQPYAADEDHLILVDTGERVARILHVDPAVTPGDRVAVGDPLGTLVRAGFFAPWVANHLHLGFREYGANHHRATGSLPLELDPALDVTALDWDGTGTVVATGETYVVLDSPTHPAPGEQFVGVAATDRAGAPLGVLDGGLPHYEYGGVLRAGETVGAVHLLGERLGTLDGRTVRWDESAILANGDPVTGLAFALGRDSAGVKLVGEGLDLPVGTDVTVEIRS